MVFELVAVDQDDAVDPGLRDLVEDVAAGPPDTDDGDGVAPEDVVECVSPARVVLVSRYTNGRPSSTVWNAAPGVAVTAASSCCAALLRMRAYLRTFSYRPG